MGSRNTIIPRIRQGSLFISCFRILCVLSLIIVSFLAFTPNEVAVVSNLNDKFNHFLAFGALAFLSDNAFPQIKFGWVKFIPLLSYGILIEVVQSFLPYRHFSLLDVAADLCGLVCYGLCISWLKKSPLFKKYW